MNGDRAAGSGGWQVREATSHRFHLQLLPVYGLHLMEGGVGADDHKGGSCRKTGSSGPACLTWPPLPTALPRSCTHPGPRRRRSPRQPARRRERRRSQPEHTDGLGSPLGLGADGIGAAVPILVPSPRVTPETPTSPIWCHKLREPQDLNSSCRGPPSPWAPPMSPMSPPTVRGNTRGLPQPPRHPLNYSSPAPTCTPVDLESPTGGPRAKSDLWMCLLSLHIIPQEFDLICGCSRNWMIFLSFVFFFFGPCCVACGILVP